MEHAEDTVSIRQQQSRPAPQYVSISIELLSQITRDGTQEVDEGTLCAPN